MREIKFRAWFPGVKKMCQFSGPRLMAEIGVYGLFFPVEERTIFIGRNIEFELMQYTGLKDKDGKEIYEGDILRFYDGEVKPWIAEVAFVGVSFSAVNRKCCLVCAKLEGCIGSIDELGELEVIGNIFENPELLAGDPP